MIECRRFLTGELAVVSQLIYKYSSPHRCTKYFQALKKVDRHMHHLLSCCILDRLTDSVGSHKAETNKAQLILAEVEGNCREVIEHCMPQVALQHFLSFHLLVIATISNIWTAVRTLREEICRFGEIPCYQGQEESKVTGKDYTNKHAIQLETKLHCDESNDRSLDTGELVSREEIAKLRPKAPDHHLKFAVEQKQNANTKLSEHQQQENHEDLMHRTGACSTHVRSSPSNIGMKEPQKSVEVNDILHRSNHRSLNPCDETCYWQAGISLSVPNASIHQSQTTVHTTNHLIGKSVGERTFKKSERGKVNAGSDSSRSYKQHHPMNRKKSHRLKPKRAYYIGSTRDCTAKHKRSITNYSRNIPLVVKSYHTRFLRYANIILEGGPFVTKRAYST